MQRGVSPPGTKCMCVWGKGSPAIYSYMHCHNSIITELEHLRKEVIVFVRSHAWHRLVCSGLASFNALLVILICAFFIDLEPYTRTRQSFVPCTASMRLLAHIPETFIGCHAHSYS